MNPITQDKLYESAGEAVRRAVYLSAVHNRAMAEAAGPRGSWNPQANQRNNREAIEACRDAGNMLDIVILLRELAERDAEYQPRRHGRRLHGNRAAEIRDELRLILAERFGIDIERLTEREAEA